MYERPQSHRRGFTLIELLVVVAIIAIISAIAVPRLIVALHQSRDKKVITEMRNFAIAIGIYSIDYEMVPNTTDISELVSVLQSIAHQQEALTISEKDSWGHKFEYYPVSQTQYTLISRGRDGAAGDAATTKYFDADADTLLITGVFAASHQGVTSVVGK